jgi:hypothetical protein
VDAVNNAWNRFALANGGMNEPSKEPKVKVSFPLPPSA